MSAGLLLAGLAAVVGLVCLGAFLYFWNDIVYRAGLRRLKERAPTRVADAQPGAEVRLTGRVRLPDRPLAAPVTQKPCAAWEVHVFQRQRYDTGNNWVSHDIGKKRQVVDFLLEDETGVARVVTENARLLLVSERVKHDGKAEADAIRERIAAGEGQVVVRDGGGLFEFHEAVLEAGEPVTVLGVATIEEDPALSGDAYRGGGRRLVVRAQGSEPVIISDDPEVAAR